MTIKTRLHNLEKQQAQQAPTWRDFVEGRYTPPNWDVFMQDTFSDDDILTIARGQADKALLDRFAQVTDKAPETWQNEIAQVIADYEAIHGPGSFEGFAKSLETTE